MSLLTDEQTTEFKRNGFVVLEDVIEEDLIEMTRDRVLDDDVPRSWDELEEMLETPDEELAVDVDERNVKMRSGDFKVNAPPARRSRRSTTHCSRTPRSWSARANSRHPVGTPVSCFDFPSARR